MHADKENTLLLPLPREKRLLIIGIGEPMRLLVKLAGQYFSGAAVSIVSNRKRDQEEAKKLALLAKKNRFPITFVEDVNTKDAMARIRQSRSNICINYGGLWIYKKAFIDLFRGLFFNCHAASLPGYRGPGDYGWGILNEEKSVSVVIHQMVRKIDAGAILMQKTRRFRKKQVYPIDYHIAVKELEKQVFRNFLQLISTSSTIELRSQNAQLAAYWPRLTSAMNGAIDIDWSAEDVRLFINAFSEPFDGAFLFYQEQKIFIKEAEISSRKKLFHPFANGLLINKDEHYLEVITGGCSILLRKMYDENGKKIPLSAFRVGDRFYMPAVVLEKARRYDPRRNR